MPKEVWTSPHGHFQITRHISEEGCENETREEWAEPLDLSVFHREDTRTPEERAKQHAKAATEWDEYLKAEGLEPNEEQRADMEALAEYLGWRNPNGEPASQ